MKNEINNLRNKIDQIDEQIAKLLAQRINIACKLGEIKRQNNLPVTDKAREELVVLNACSHANTPEQKQAISAVYKAIINECTNVQK